MCIKLSSTYKKKGERGRRVGGGEKMGPAPTPDKNPSYANAYRIEGNQHVNLLRISAYLVQHLQRQGYITRQHFEYFMFPDFNYLIRLKISLAELGFRGFSNGFTVRYQFFGDNRLQKQQEMYITIFPI